MSRKWSYPQARRVRLAVLTGNMKGVSFWEILLSLTLTVIGMVVVLAVMAQSAVYARRMDIQFTASNIAQERIATLRAMDFSMLENAGEADVPVDMAGNIDPDGDFLRTTIITVYFAGDANLTHVEVQVEREHVEMTGRRAGFRGEPSVIMETVISPFS